jgi:prephenate dehydrogenase
MDKAIHLLNNLLYAKGDKIVQRWQEIKDKPAIDERTEQERVFEATQYAYEKAISYNSRTWPQVVDDIADFKEQLKELKRVWPEKARELEREFEKHKPDPRGYDYR